LAALAEILVAQPFWFWAGLAVALLAVEAATGTGWLLWPAASAGRPGDTGNS
jgi:membrane protein implicated in regulation of membrane protease activity